MECPHHPLVDVGLAGHRRHGHFVHGKNSLGDALYFSFVTGLTIGYGDIVVKSTEGRVIAVLIGFVGVFFTGLIIAAAVESIRKYVDLTRSKE